MGFADRIDLGLSELLVEEFSSITLPQLPYNYRDLKPCFSSKALETHHRGHHAKYIQNLKDADKELKSALKSNNKHLINYWLNEVQYNRNAHELHTLFWMNMTPEKTEPSDLLAQALKESFKSIDQFKQSFRSLAESIRGSGWVALALQGSSGLTLAEVKNHNLSLFGSCPILVLDMWEHSFYTDYQDHKSDYIRSWWKVVNWDDVSSRFSVLS